MTELFIHAGLDRASKDLLKYENISSETARWCEIFNFSGKQCLFRQCHWAFNRNSVFLGSVIGHSIETVSFKALPSWGSHELRLFMFILSSKVLLTTWSLYLGLNPGTTIKWSLILYCLKWTWTDEVRDCLKGNLPAFINLWKLASYTSCWSSVGSEPTFCLSIVRKLT